MSVGAYLGRLAHPDFAEDEGYQQWIRRLKKAVLKGIESQSGRKVAWEEGDDPEEEVGQDLGGWDNLLQLQRYAAHVQFTGRPPEGPAGDDEIPVEEDEYLSRYHEAMESEARGVGVAWGFRHIIMTANEVRYIPAEFPEPLLVEEEGSDEVTSVGSSYKLREELDELNRHLLLPGDYGDLGDEEAWKIYDNEGDPWRFVKWVWVVLHWLSRESIKRKLCIHLA